MSVKSNLQKGKDLENFVAGLLQQFGIDPDAVRQIGSGSGKAKGDIHTNCGWSFECKNTARFDFKSAAEQVQREAMGFQKEVIVWHPPKKPLSQSVAIINVSDFMELLKKNEAPMVKSEDRNIKFKIQRLVQTAKDVINILE